VEDVEIATGPVDQITILPLSGHPLADESLYDPPLNCIDEILLRDFTSKVERDIYYEPEERYQPPPALKIDNTDGSPITLRQFVIELHAYIQRNRQEIIRVKAEMYGTPITHADGSQGREIVFGRPAKLPDDIDIRFYNAMPLEIDGRTKLLVWLHADGEFSSSQEFWATRLLQVRNLEQQR
jgi:hypothetical protein